MNNNTDITPSPTKTHNPFSHTLKAEPVKISESHLMLLVKQAAQEIEDPDTAVAFATGILVATEALLTKSVSNREGNPSASITFPGFAKVTLTIEDLRETKPQ